MGEDIADDLYEMNDLSIAIVGAPMGVALAPTNPAREQVGRLIQDARVVQTTDADLRRRLVQVAKSTLGNATPSEHEALLLDTYTAAAMVGSSVVVGRVIESMGDARFCRWLASAMFK